MLVMGLAAALCLWLCLWQNSLADKPATEAQDRIRQALEGRRDPDASGDGVLDDVLDLIDQRGSILDGSALDDRTNRPPGRSVAAISSRVGCRTIAEIVALVGIARRAG